jgi:hypothetical protein
MTAIAVGIGLPTLPSGPSAHAIRVARADPDLPVRAILRGAMPFAAAMILSLAVPAVFDGSAPWPARL